MAESHNAQDPMDSSQTNHQTPKGSLTPLPAAEDDYRYLRKRATILCAAFNAQPFDASDKERAQAWNDIVGLGAQSNDSENAAAPMIKSPIRIDYGTNIHIHPSCFINWDCYIADSPDCTITIGENTIIGVSARILGVTHPIDWRERQGRLGPSLAGDVKIGNDCFIGAGVTILPGVSIGDGCVIGAGSVVSKSVPAYHLAAGVPACVIRKVAADVPDALSPDLEVKDDPDTVRGSTQDRCQSHREIECSSRGKMIGKVQLLACLDVVKAKLPVWHGKPRHIAVDTCVVVAAATFGYWLRG